MTTATAKWPRNKRYARPAIRLDDATTHSLVWCWCIFCMPSCRETAVPTSQRHGTGFPHFQARERARSTRKLGARGVALRWPWPCPWLARSHGMDGDGRHWMVTDARERSPAANRWSPTCNLPRPSTKISRLNRTDRCACCWATYIRVFDSNNPLQRTEMQRASERHGRFPRLDATSKCRGRQLFSPALENALPRSASVPVSVSFLRPMTARNYRDRRRRGCLIGGQMNE